MKTDELADFLAQGAGPAPRAPLARRFGVVLPAGLALGLIASVTGLGLMPPVMWGDPAFWVKLGYAAALCAACVWLASRLARPGAPFGKAAWTLGAVAAAMGLAGVAALLATPPDLRSAFLFGNSVLRCPWAILALSMPTLVGALWALRDMAPTRPRLTGLAAGLLAGGTGAAAYALACDETSLTFISLWYSLGIGLAGAVGSAFGPRFLRW